MILEVLSHTLQVLDHGDAKALQFRLVTDPGLKQKFGCLDCSQGHNNFAVSCHPMKPARELHFDPGRPPAFEEQSCDKSTGQYGEVGTVDIRPNVGAKNGVPLPIAVYQFSAGA